MTHAVAPALALVQELANETPNDLEIQMDLARLHQMLGQRREFEQALARGGATDSMWPSPIPALPSHRFSAGSRRRKFSMASVIHCSPPIIRTGLNLHESVAARVLPESKGKLRS